MSMLNFRVVFVIHPASALALQSRPQQRYRKWVRNEWIDVSLRSVKDIRPIIVPCDLSPQGIRASQSSFAFLQCENTKNQLYSPFAELLSAQNVDSNQGVVWLCDNFYSDEA